MTFEDGALLRLGPRAGGVTRRGLISRNTAVLASGEGLGLAVGLRTTETMAKCGQCKPLRTGLSDVPYLH